MSFCAYTLFSGSKGNSAYIAAGETRILIDAGVGIRSLEKSLNSLGTSLSRITDIFVTHDHSDHTRGLEAICAHCDVKVHITAPSSEVIITSDTPCLARKACIHPVEYAEKVGDLRIESFVTSHDSKASVGYVIKSPECSVGYATDMGLVTDRVKESLTGVDAIVLEANHDVDMLSCGSYPAFLKKRILSRVGHLSNDDAAEFAAYLAEHGTKRFLLAHLSEQNNDPEAAYGAVYCALGGMTSSGVFLAVAEVSTPTKLVSIE